MTPHSPPDSSVRGISQTRISEWVAVSFSQARDWTWVSCIAGSFFTDWTTREALSTPLTHGKSLLNFLSHWRMLVMVHGSHPRRINSRYFGCLKSLRFSSGRGPGVWNGNPLPYSCLGNSMNRGVEGLQSQRDHKESDTTKHTHKG